jgi:hypothetical protein
VHTQHALICRRTIGHAVNSHTAAHPAWRFLVLAAALLAGAIRAPLHAQTADVPGPVRVTRATDVVSRWQPPQHLYVKGDLGVGATQLAQLEQWLDQNATNWTVVLVESAQDETYRDAAGSSYTGMDAVEHALGKGLPNQTGFGQLTDARTGEHNGAFFVLFLRDRKFSYFGSDAQDRHGVGEDHWGGSLDQPAIAAMRGGGRIVDAVKDTISSIDRQLGQNIVADQRRREQQAAAEKAQREQREAAARVEQQRTVEQAGASLRTATEAVGLLAQKRTALLQGNPGLSGDIAQPDIAGMEADLASARTTFDAGHPAAARTLADSVKQRAMSAVRAIEDFLKDGPEIDGVARSLKETAALPFSQAARTELDAGGQSLKQAGLAHARADSAYVAALATARQCVQSARNRAVAAAEADRQARERAEAAARLHRHLILAGTATGLIALGALGIILNLLRRGRKQEALALVEVWSKALDEKTFALFSLLERTHRIVGASREEASQRYAGETLRLSQQIIRDVDELMIMSACATRILNGARGLATPAGAAGRFINLFAAAKYKGTIRRLRDEPIVFQPEEGLELAIRGSKTERERLLGSLESYQPFKLSFNELIAGFNQRAGRALASLDQVETSLVKGGGLLEATQEAIRAAQAMEDEIGAAGRIDNQFLVTPAFSALLPAARNDLAEATRMSVRDPVGALQTSGASASQKAGDALELVRLARDFQQTLRPALRDAVSQLDAVPLQTGWISAAVTQRSTRADELARQALTSAIAPAIAALREDLNKLVECAAQTVALDLVRRGKARKSIEDADALIASARQELAVLLTRNASEILREPEHDPSDRVSQARGQIEGSKAALERGDVAAAQGALDAVASLTAAAAMLVESTRTAFAAHAGEIAARRTETGRLENLVPEHDGILAQLRSRYDSQALLLGQGDPTHPNANGTIEDNLQEVQGHLTAAREMTDRAARLFRDAQILQAAEVLVQVAARQAEAGFRLQEVVEKQQRLRETGAANETLDQQLQNRIHGMESTLNDPRTMEAAMRAFDSAAQRLAAAGRLRAATPCNPFQVAAELAAVRGALDSVADQVRCDWDLHAEADRSLKAAAAQIENAGRLSREAATDNVPDSPAIQQARQMFENLAAALSQAQSRLPVPHGDWRILDAEADRITNEAGRAAAALRGELQAAQTALAALSAAAAHVRSAGGWTGGFGVAILGAPGSDFLAQARALLGRGDYQQTWRLAEAARAAAQAAIEEAEAEVRRRRRAEEERQERERRQREAAEQRRRDSMNHSSFSSGSSGFSHSGFSSSSGSSHSSFSSGSGTSRSGW